MKEIITRQLGPDNKFRVRVEKASGSLAVIRYETYHDDYYGWENDCGVERIRIEEIKAAAQLLGLKGKL